jgi:hypothetical protein
MILTKIKLSKRGAPPQYLTSCLHSKDSKGQTPEGACSTLEDPKLVDMWGLQVKRQDERCWVGWVTNEIDSALLSPTGWAIELTGSYIWCPVIPLFFSVSYLMTSFPVSRLYRVSCYCNGLMMNWKGFRKKRLWPNRDISRNVGL